MNAIHRIAVIAIAGASLAVVSCSTGGRSPSGFLSQYKQLNPGNGKATAVSSYVKSGADLKKYDSVMIDPVTTVIASSGISPEVGSQLAAYLSDSLRSQVSGNMKLTSIPGPTTLRIRAALSDVREGSEHGRPVTSVHSAPQAVLTGSIGSSELAAFVSNVSLEGEVLDSVSGERLTAMRNHRIGAKREATAATSWAAVRSAVNQGATGLWQRFTNARGE